MDLGVSRTIDHAVYTILNAIAIILWRFNSAIVGMSLFSYNTQDWLTNRPDGGVWQVLDKVAGPAGLFGLATWQAFLLLAIMLFGLSRILRAFIQINPVDPGRLLLYAVFSYAVIQGGSGMMQSVEAWRSSVGDYMYQGVAADGSVDLDLPGVTTNDEPISAPGDLDGRAPIRGWEAVATSYFLAGSEEELNANIPPEAFRRAYCLYDPNREIQEQTEENEAGCSPQKAWDEWDMVSTQPLTQVWGIPLPIDVSLDLPVIREHPENRQLAIRQAQAGVARLALGPIVALYPLLEANISLMLALSAAMIYLSLPVMLLFGFFLYTESLATRLLLRLITIILQTIILNGLIALFLLLLIKVSIQGSLMAYLGLTGVAVLGGLFLARVAASSMKETLSQVLGAVGGVWMGAATGVMGREAARPASALLGLAKVGAAAATLSMVPRLGTAWDLADAGLHTARSGVRDLDRATPEAMTQVRKTAGQLPAPLARLAQAAVLDTDEARPADPYNFNRVTPPLLTSAAGGGSRRIQARTPNEAQGRTMDRDSGPPAVFSASGPAGITEQPVAERYSQAERLAVWQATQQALAQDQTGRYTQSGGTLTAEGRQAVLARLDRPQQQLFQTEPGQRELAALVEAQRENTRARGWGVPELRQGRVDEWVGELYAAQATGRGEQRVLEAGRGLLGETLSLEAGQALNRHTVGETQAALQAIRQAAVELPPDAMLAQGTLTDAGQQAVRRHLDQDTRRAFSGEPGRQDLAALTALAVQQDMTAEPAEFRQVTARTPDGQGVQAPGRTVPPGLGLDPVAAGAHFAGLNRFVRVSDQAGLTPEQREQLLAETRAGEVSTELRGQIVAALRRQAERGRAVGLTPAEVIASAQALPETLSGPMQIQLPKQPAQSPPESLKTPIPEAKQSERPITGGVTIPTTAPRENIRQAQVQDAAALRETLAETWHTADGEPAQSRQVVTELRRPVELTATALPGQPAQETSGPLPAGQAEQRPAEIEPGAGSPAGGEAGRDERVALPGNPGSSRTETLPVQVEPPAGQPEPRAAAGATIEPAAVIPPEFSARPQSRPEPDIATELVPALWRSIADDPATPGFRELASKASTQPDNANPEAGSSKQPPLSKIEPLPAPSEPAETPGTISQQGNTGPAASPTSKSGGRPAIPPAGLPAANENQRPAGDAQKPGRVAEELRAQARTESGVTGQVAAQPAGRGMAASEHRAAGETGKAPKKAAGDPTVRSKLLDVGSQAQAGGERDGVAAELRRGRVADATARPETEKSEAGKKAQSGQREGAVVEALSSDGQVVTNGPQLTEAEPAVARKTEMVTTSLEPSQAPEPGRPNSTLPAIAARTPAQSSEQDTQPARPEPLIDYFGPAPTPVQGNQVGSATGKVESGLTQMGRAEAPLPASLAGTPEPSPSKKRSKKRRDDRLPLHPVEPEPRAPKKRAPVGGSKATKPKPKRQG